MITYSTDIGNTRPGVIQFENVNEGRSYPFEDNVILETNDGKVLPENVISDLHLVIPTGNNAYLSNVYISENMISVCLKIFGQDSLFSALSVRVKIAEFEPYVPYRLEKLTGSEDTGGIITFGNIDFSSLGAVYRFSDRKIGITESAVSRYQPALLRSIIDDRTGESVHGDVKIRFSSYVNTERSYDGVHLSLAEGAASALASKCDKERPTNECGATPVQSINGVESDDEKRIVIWFH